jgi:hypothetical protein
MARLTVGEFPSRFSTRERLNIRSVRRTGRSWPAGARAVKQRHATTIIAAAKPKKTAAGSFISSMHPIVASMTGSGNHGSPSGSAAEPLCPETA